MFSSCVAFSQQFLWLRFCRTASGSQESSVNGTARQRVLANQPVRENADSTTSAVPMKKAAAVDAAALRKRCCGQTTRLAVVAAIR
jgi:hypothetical protein